MNRWLSISFNDESARNIFISTVNKEILKNMDKVYFKIFTPKDKNHEGKIFLIADEGSVVIKKIEKVFNLLNILPPKRDLLKKVCGNSANREWMFIKEIKK